MGPSQMIYPGEVACLNECFMSLLLGQNSGVASMSIMLGYCPYNAMAQNGDSSGWGWMPSEGWKVASGFQGWPIAAFPSAFCH